MATERPGLGSPAIRELRVTATMARQELNNAAREITPNGQRVERALANFDLINRLRNLPSVQGFLEATGVSIEINRAGIFGVSRELIVSHEGVISCLRGSGVTPLNEDVIRSWGKPLKAKSTKEEISNEEFVCILAEMKPRKIIRKFLKVISAPLKLELQ